MIGILPRILILASGCLIGHLLASSPIIGNDVDSPKRRNLPRTETSPAEELLKTSTTSTLNCEPAQVAMGNQQANEQSLPLAVSELPVTRLPAKYHNMVEPRSREPQTLAERYQAFLKEARDEVWATPIEARIKELITVSGVQGIQAEYVSCRRRSCTVAGYVDPTAGFDSCSITGRIGRAHIFPGAFGVKCKDEEIAGLQRFVVLIDARRP